MRFDTFLAIQKTPNTLVTRDHMFEWVVGLRVWRGGSELLIQTVGQPVTKKNSCLLLIPCSHSLPLTHTASQDGEDSFITQQNKLKQREVALPPGSSLNQPSALLTLFKHTVSTLHTYVTYEQNLINRT